MGCSGPMNRRRPYPYCCDGGLWRVTRGFFGCGITGDLVRRLWESGVMLLDRVWERWMCLLPSLY